MKRFIYLVAFLFFAMAGCYYDKGELVYPPVGNVPGANCDTSNVRYSVEVVNILSANCYVCHGGNASNGNGYKLDIYAGPLRTFATNGRLVQAIEWTGPANTHMPRGGSKLNACDIAKIKTWVRNGALNN